MALWATQTHWTDCTATAADFDAVTERLWLGSPEGSVFCRGVADGGTLHCRRQIVGGDIHSLTSCIEGVVATHNGGATLLDHGGATIVRLGYNGNGGLVCRAWSNPKHPAIVARPIAMEESGSLSADRLAIASTTDPCIHIATLHAMQSVPEQQDMGETKTHDGVVHSQRVFVGSSGRAGGAAEQVAGLFVGSSADMMHVGGTRVYATTSLGRVVQVDARGRSPHALGALKAHGGGVLDLAASGSILVTCGRLESGLPDPVMKIWDMRMNRLLASSAVRSAMGRGSPGIAAVGLLNSPTPGLLGPSGRVAFALGRSGVVEGMQVQGSGGALGHLWSVGSAPFLQASAVALAPSGGLAAICTRPAPRVGHAPYQQTGSVFFASVGSAGPPCVHAHAHPLEAASGATTPATPFLDELAPRPQVLPPPGVPVHTLGDQDVNELGWASSAVLVGLQDRLCSDALPAPSSRGRMSQAKYFSAPRKQAPHPVLDDLAHAHQNRTVYVGSRLPRLAQECVVFCDRGVAGRLMLDVDARRSDPARKAGAAAAAGAAGKKDKQQALPPQLMPAHEAEALVQALRPAPSAGTAAAGAGAGGEAVSAAASQGAGGADTGFSTPLWSQIPEWLHAHDASYGQGTKWSPSFETAGDFQDGRIVDRPADPASATAWHLALSTGVVPIESTGPSPFAGAVAVLLLALKPFREAVADQLSAWPQCLASEFRLLLDRCRAAAGQQGRFGASGVWVDAILLQRAVQTLADASPLDLPSPSSADLATRAGRFLRLALRKVPADLQRVAEAGDGAASGGGGGGRGSRRQRSQEAAAAAVAGAVPAKELAKRAQRLVEAVSLTREERLYEPAKRPADGQARSAADMVTGLSYGDGRAVPASFAKAFEQCISGSMATRAWVPGLKRFGTMLRERRLVSAPPAVLVNLSSNMPGAADLWYAAARGSEDPVAWSSCPASPDWLPDGLLVRSAKGMPTEVEGLDAAAITAQAPARLRKAGGKKADVRRRYIVAGLVSVIHGATVDPDHKAPVASERAVTSLLLPTGAAPADGGQPGHGTALVFGGRSWGWFHLAGRLVTPCSSDDALRRWPTWRQPVSAMLVDLSTLASWWTEPTNGLALTSPPRPLSSTVFQWPIPLPDGRVKAAKPGALPKAGDILGLDAEFVKAASTAPHEDLLKVARLMAGRVSVVRTSGEVLFDHWIAASEVVVDPLTRFSGIHQGELDPSSSPHTLLPMRHVVAQLRALLALGVVFVGHGLSQDFAILGIDVPPNQVRDTVRLYRQAGHRSLSLRFLARHLLEGATIQDDVHDSVEDARAALQLFQRLQGQDEERRQRELEQLYQEGSRSGWR